MATFPTTESEILVLAQSISAGLSRNPAIFPNPPVPQWSFSMAGILFIAARAGAVKAQAAVTAAVAAKDEALARLVDAMKANLRYAEDTVHDDDAKLKLIGWGGRAAATPAPALALPGQPQSLATPRQGEGWIFLDWKEPMDGGAVNAYKVQRRLCPDGPWIDVGTAVDSETTLVSQERGKEWEYRVSAVNKAGEGAPSNTVMAVL